MIDVWFLFNLLKPFVDIIAQTFIETLREHPDEKNVKEDNFAWLECINSKKVSMYALKYIFSIISIRFTYFEKNIDRSINERKQQKAMATFFSEAQKQKRNKRKIALCQKFLRLIYPGICVFFIIIFWSVGLMHRMK